MPKQTMSYQARRYDALAGRKKARPSTAIVRSAYSGIMRGPSLPPGWSKTASGSRGPMRARSEELKYLDIAAAAYKFETDATRAVLINGIATGSTAITREGNQVYWKAIQIRGEIHHTAVAAASQTRCDLYVIYDDQPGAAVPSNSEILTSSQSAAFLNLDYRERFRVLHHSMYVFGPSDTTATQTYIGDKQIYPVDVYVRCNVRTAFKGTGNAIGDISKGAIYVFTIGDTADAGGDYGASVLAIRLRFSER